MCAARSPPRKRWLFRRSHVTKHAVVVVYEKVRLPLEQLPPPRTLADDAAVHVAEATAALHEVEDEVRDAYWTGGL